MYDLIAVGEVLTELFLPALRPGERVHMPLRPRAGGTAVNVARAAATLGARAAVVGRVGDDDAGRAVAEELREAGIDALLAADGERPTGALVAIGAGDEAAVVADRGANAGFCADDVPEGLETRVVAVSGYLLLQEDAAAGALAALRRVDAPLRAAGLGSAGLVTARGRTRTLALVAGATVVVGNAEELRALTGLAPAEAALALSNVERTVCVTLGAAGAVAALAGELVRVPVTAPRGERTFGAGDAFAAGFLLARAGGASLAAALAAGCALGGSR